MQAAVEVVRSEANGPRAKDLVRILDGQQTQLSTGIAALDRRCDELPHAERFHRLEWRHPAPDQTRRSPATGPAVHGLEGLAAMHLELAANIREVMEHHLKEQAEPALEGVARDHEEMAWVLSALTHEGEFVEGGFAPDPVRPPNQTTGESRWENEGGSMDDGPGNAGGADRRGSDSRP